VELELCLVETDSCVNTGSLACFRCSDLACFWRRFAVGQYRSGDHDEFALVRFGSTGARDAMLSQDSQSRVVLVVQAQQVVVHRPSCRLTGTQVLCDRCGQGVGPDGFDEFVSSSGDILNGGRH
jgi:hypothetical protein